MRNPHRKMYGFTRLRAFTRNLPNTSVFKQKKKADTHIMDRNILSLITTNPIPTKMVNFRGEYNCEEKIILYV